MPQSNAYQRTQKSNFPARLPPVKTGVAAAITEGRRKLLHALKAARLIISPAIFEATVDPWKSRIKTMMVPVPDSGWAPNMWCGEFAIVDTTNTDPEGGAFVLRRSGAGKNMAIVRLELWDESGSLKIVPKPGENPGVYWKIVYGAQSATRLDGKPFDDDDFLSRFHMADGPLSDRFMREEIIGRVVGVLGHEGRTMNWQRWRN
jgi:hypothetical protein